MNKALGDISVDDLVMSAAALALASPAEKRDACIEGACGGDAELIRQVRDYLEWEERMDGFLEEDLFGFTVDQPPFARGDFVAARFDILSQLGEGGMGWVYEAWDKTLERRVALKCAKRGFHKRLPPEVGLAREIAHDNVCRVHDIHTTQDSQGEIEFFSMEFLKGETLAARLGRGRPAQAEAADLAAQICKGLAEAHRKGVVHGDVKSNNIILAKRTDGSTRAVITDFGLARMPGMAGVRGTAQSMAGGAMDYMAPEIWRGEKATFASDIYGLGVILCELFAGHRPFGPDTPVNERFTGRLPPLHRKWDGVLARCLHPDPARRFQNGGEAAKALSPNVRHWRWVATAASLAALLGGAATYNVMTSPQEVVRLAVLPFGTDPASAPLSQGALLDAGNRLSHAKSTRARRLTVIPVSDALQNRADQPAKARTLLGATEALTGEWRRDSGRIALSVHLIDTSSLAHVRDWQASYSDNEAQDIPVALAGMVAGALRLPPLAVAPTVNAVAYRDYSAGSALTRRDPDVQRAIPLLQHAVELDSNSPLTHAKLAEAYWLEYTTTKDPVWQKRALSSLADAEKRNPDTVEVRLVSGMINDASGKYDQAQKDLLRAIDLDPDNGDVWRQLGHVYEDSDRPGDALSAYQRAIAVQKGYFKNSLDLGAYFFRLGDYEEAVRQRKIAVGLAPDLADAHYALAAPYLNLGRYDDAEYELNLVKNQSQDSARIELGLGLVRLLRGENSEAINYFKRAIDLGPATPPYYVDLGTALRRAGFEQEALEEYRKGRNLAQADLPSNPTLAYERACLAYLWAQLHDGRQAESEIGQALNSSHDADVHWMAVQTYEVLGEWDRALKLLQDAPVSMFFLVGSNPDMAQFRAGPGFQNLLAARNIHYQ